MENIMKLCQKAGILEKFNEKKEKEKIQEIGKREKGQFSILDLELKRNVFDWMSIYKICEKQPSRLNKKRYAHFAIEAAVNLGQWEDAKTWVPHIDEDKKNEEVKLWLTMLHVHDKKYEEAQKFIGGIRYNMNDKIRQMFSLSYDKSMKGVLFLQQVSQLEEIVKYEKANKRKILQGRYVEE